MLADANVVRLYSEIVAKLLGAGARGTGPFEQPMLLQDGNRRSLSEENKKGGANAGKRLARVRSLICPALPAASSATARHDQDITQERNTTVEFDDWIAEHTKLMAHVARTVDGTASEPLHSSKIRKTNCCDLGRWICGDGTGHHASLRYRELMASHIEFHVVAASLMKKVEADDRPGAVGVFHGAFASASAALLRAIVDFMLETHRGGRPESDQAGSVRARKDGK